jgi:hypothetical protein
MPSASVFAGRRTSAYGRSGIALHHPVGVDEWLSSRRGSWF